MKSLYLQYDVVSREYPGWSLREVKSLSARERQYWVDLIRWRSDSGR